MLGRFYTAVLVVPLLTIVLSSQTGVVFTCQYCQTAVNQPFGKVISKETAKGKEMTAFKTVAGPTASNGSACEECGGTMHVSMISLHGNEN